MANEISLDITETVTKVEVTEDVTSINITPSVTTIELKGISIAQGFSSTATTYDGSSNTLGYGTSVSAALDHINTNGFNKNADNTIDGDTTVAYGHKIDFTGAGQGQNVYAAMNLRNNNIIGVNNLKINDAGDHEGVEWPNWKIFESPNPFDGEGVDGNQEGNFQIAYENGSDNWETRLEVKPGGIDVTGTITFDGGTTSADLNFGDGDKAVFGASENLKIYFDGNHSYVYDMGPGDLRVRGNNLYLQNDTGGNYLSAINGGATTLFYNGNTTLATTNSGVDITGDLVVDKVGIGTDTPSNQLTLKSTSAGDTSGIRWDNGTESVKAYFNNGDADSDFFITYTGTNGPEVRFQHDGDIILNSGSDGNVGIGTNNPATALDVTGTITASEKMEAPLFKGDLEGAVHFKATDSGTTLAKGDVVYITGYEGNKTTVDKADASDSAKMPSFGIVNSVTGSNVDVLTFGSMLHLSTTGIATGTELYVSATTPGGYETSAPTGEGNLVQKIAKVVRGDSNSGSIKIMGAGRTNATPNLNNGNIFIGNSSNIPTTASFDTTAATFISGDRTYGDITTTGKIYGPSTLVIDPSPHDATGGNVKIEGSLIVNGTTTQLKTQSLDVQDNVISLNRTGSDITATTTGFSAFTGTGNTNATILFNTANRRWTINDSLQVQGALYDSGGNAGDSGNVLKATGEGETDWGRLSISDLSDVNTTNVANDKILKYSSAASGWIVADDAGGIALTDISVSVETAGTANLSYNNANGVFTYTPPDLSSYLTSYTETDPVVGAINGIVKADGDGNISAATGSTDGTGDYSTVKIGTGANDALAGNTTYVSTETDPVVGAINGIVKADGAGNISAATGSTDGTGDYSTVKIGTGANDALAGNTTYIATETDPVVGAIDGIVKADGAGVISAAVAGTDYSTLALGTDSTTALAGDSSIEDLSNVSSSLSPASNSVLAYNSTDSEYQPYLLNDIAEIENQYIEVSTGAGVVAHRPYYASAWDGTNNRPIVTLTDADNEQPCIGIATETVGSGSVTKLLTKGILTGVNTSTTNYPGTGNLLYISSSQGQLTRTAPVSYQKNLQQVATVLKTDLSTGVLLVDITASQVGVANLAEGYIAYGGANGEQTARYDDVSLPIRASAGPSGSREYWNVLRLTDANNNYTGDINHIQIGQAEADEDSQLVDKISLFPGASGVRIHNSEAIGTEGISGQTLAFHTTDDGIHVGNDRRGTYTAGDLMVNDDTDFGMLAGSQCNNYGRNNFGFGFDIDFNASTNENFSAGARNTVRTGTSNSVALGGSVRIGDSSFTRTEIFGGGFNTKTTNDYGFSWGYGVYQAPSTEYFCENDAKGGVLFGHETVLTANATNSFVGGAKGGNSENWTVQKVDSENCFNYGKGSQILSNSDNSGAIGLFHELDTSPQSFAAGYLHRLENTEASAAVGQEHTITAGDDYCFAAGYSNEVLGNGGACIGYELKTPLNNTGTNPYEWEDYCTVVGGYNDETKKFDTDNGVGATWVQNQRFVVGTGTDGSKKTGFVVAAPTTDFSGIIMTHLAESTSHATPADARDAGVPTGGLYRTGNDVKILLAGD